MADENDPSRPLQREAFEGNLRWVQTVMDLMMIATGLCAGGDDPVFVNHEHVVSSLHPHVAFCCKAADFA